MTDRSIPDLVGAARGGDASAFEELYRRTSHQMMGLALSMLRHEQDALDVLQDSYLYAFGKLDQLEKPESFAPWLFRLVANRCKNHLTRTRPKRFAASLTDGEGAEWELEDEDSAGRPDESLDSAETRRLVMEMVESLPEDQRVCVLLHYVQEMKVSEIAALLESSENTIKSRLSYARKKLRAQVEALERQGTRLHGAALLPMLPRILADRAARSLATGGPALLEGILRDTGAAAAATAGGAAAATAAGGGATAGTATTVLGTVAGKVAAGIVVAALAVGGAGLLLSWPEPEPEMEPEPMISEAPVMQEPQPEAEPAAAADAVTMTFLFQDGAGNATDEIVAVGIRIGGHSVVLDDRVTGRYELYSEEERASGQTVISAAQAQELELLWDFSDTATSLSFSTRQDCTPAFYHQRDSGSTSISRRFRATGDHTVVVQLDGGSIRWN